MQLTMTEKELIRMMLNIGRAVRTTEKGRVMTSTRDDGARTSSAAEKVANALQLSLTMLDVLAGSGRRARACRAEGFSAVWGWAGHTLDIGRRHHLLRQRLSHIMDWRLPVACLLLDRFFGLSCTSLLRPTLARRRRIVLPWRSTTGLHCYSGLVYYVCGDQSR